MTIAQALKFAAAKLSLAKISLPRLETEILLSGILKKPREFLLAHGEKKLAENQISNLKFKISRRLKGEPVAYLTGHKEFYGLDFAVNKNVLIPRPETELLVEEALKHLRRNRPAPAGAKHITLVDAGTGSGCIIITLTKYLKSKFPISIFQFQAIDISKSALAVARKNARFHQVNKNIKFISGNLLKPILNPKFVIRNSKLIILANLPYGWKAWKNNCSRDSLGLKYEPPIALFADQTGLALYEKLFKQIKELPIASYGLRDICALCEFDPRQTKMMKKLIKQELPQAKCQIKKDLSGLNRLAIITIPARTDR